MSGIQAGPQFRGVEPNLSLMTHLSHFMDTMDTSEHLQIALERYLGAEIAP